MDNNNQLLQVLTKEGVLIRVSVRYFRGTKKLKPEDLGLKEDSVSDRLISLGHKRLFPKDALADLALVEGRAHASVEANTFPFLNGLAHFLPNARLQEITSKLNELEAEFWKAKGAFVEKYATVRREAAEEWRKVAKKLTTDADRLVAAIEAAFPTADRLDRFFGFEVQLFQIAVPDRLGIDLVSLAEHQAVASTREQATREAAAKIRNDVQAFVSDCVASR